MGLERVDILKFGMTVFKVYIKSAAKFYYGLTEEIIIVKVMIRKLKGGNTKWTHDLLAHARTHSHKNEVYL